MIVHQLSHGNKYKKNKIDYKCLGFFSSYEVMNISIEKYKLLPGFSNEKKGFFLEKNFIIDDDSKGLKILSDIFGRLV